MRSRIPWAVLAALLGFSAGRVMDTYRVFSAEAGAAQPDYLGYFNAFAGERPEQIVAETAGPSPVAGSEEGDCGVFWNGTASGFAAGEDGELGDCRSR